jgi:hypothetical protein
MAGPPVGRPPPAVGRDSTAEQACRGSDRCVRGRGFDSRRLHSAERSGRFAAMMISRRSGFDSGLSGRRRRSHRRRRDVKHRPFGRQPHGAPSPAETSRVPPRAAVPALQATNGAGPPAPGLTRLKLSASICEYAADPKRETQGESQTRADAGGASFGVRGMISSCARLWLRRCFLRSRVRRAVSPCRLPECLLVRRRTNAFSASTRESPAVGRRGRVSRRSTGFLVLGRPYAARDS